MVWRAYVALHQHVYEELKKDRPELPIFASWTLHNMFKKRGEMLDDWKKLMPYNDLVAVSYYPFFVEDKMINNLTLDAFCPISKEPDYKKCAVKVEKV